MRYPDLTRGQRVDNFTAALFVGMGWVIGALFVSGGAHATDRLDEPAYVTERALSTPLFDIARAGERLVTVGERGHILYSDDEGVTWLQASVPVRVSLTALSFANDRVGWAVGHDTVILKTEDGGATWRKQLDGNSANRIRRETISDMLRRLEEAAASASGLELQDLEDWLANVQLLNEEIERDLEIGPHKALLTVHFHNTHVGVAVGANGLVLATEDGGEQWQDWSTRLRNNTLLHFYDVTSFDDGRFLIVGELGEIHRSSPDRTVWEGIPSPTEVSLFGLVRDRSGAGAFAVGMAGKVYKTSNGGNDWESVPSGTDVILQGGSLDQEGRPLIVGLEGAVLRTRGTREEFGPLELSAFALNTGIVTRGAGGYVVTGRGGVRLFDENHDAKPIKFGDD